MRRHLIVLVVLSIVWALSRGLAHAADPPPSTTPTTRPSALDSVIPELQFDSVPLEESLDMLADKTHANIVVNWPAIEAAGVSRKTPIRVHLWNVPLHTALSVVLQVASNKIELSYAMQEGLIHVSTADDIEGVKTTRVYNIRDMMESDAAYRMSHPSPSTSNPPIANQTSPVLAVDYDDIAGGYLDAIQSGVEPDTWKPNGGTNVITALGGRLVVTAPPHIHRQIAALLEKLRQTGPHPGSPQTRPAPAVH